MMIPLRPLLWLDAATCTAMAGLLLGAGQLLAPVLGLPLALLTEAGIILLPFALFVGWTALQRTPGPALRFVILANAFWVVGSLALLLGPWLSPTVLGSAFIAAQGVAVAVIAWLQRAALRTQAMA